LSIPIISTTSIKTQALGVSLYELATGHPPFPFAEREKMGELPHFPCSGSRCFVMRMAEKDESEGRMSMGKGLVQNISADRDACLNFFLGEWNEFREYQHCVLHTGIQNKQFSLMQNKKVIGGNNYRDDNMGQWRQKMAQHYCQGRLNQNLQEYCQERVNNVNMVQGMNQGMNRENGNVQVNSMNRENGNIQSVNRTIAEEEKKGDDVNEGSSNGSFEIEGDGDKMMEADLKIERHKIERHKIERDKIEKRVKFDDTNSVNNKIDIKGHGNSMKKLHEIKEDDNDENEEEIDKNDMNHTSEENNDMGENDDKFNPNSFCVSRFWLLKTLQHPRLKSADDFDCSKLNSQVQFIPQKFKRDSIFERDQVKRFSPGLKNLISHMFRLNVKKRATAKELVEENEWIWAKNSEVEGEIMTEDVLTVVNVIWKQKMEELEKEKQEKMEKQRQEEERREKEREKVERERENERLLLLQEKQRRIEEQESQRKKDEAEVEVKRLGVLLIVEDGLKQSNANVARSNNISNMQRSVFDKQEEQLRRIRSIQKQEERGGRKDEEEEKKHPGGGTQGGGMQGGGLQGGKVETGIQGGNAEPGKEVAPQGFLGGYGGFLGGYGSSASSLASSAYQVASQGAANLSNKFSKPWM
jgi:hypothetical protein